MERQFTVVFHGVVKSNPDTDFPNQLVEMEQAVTASFRPDLNWGVEVLTTEVRLSRFTKRERGSE